MRESHREGIPNRSDPESCAAHRQVRREALTGAHAGWVLSFENIDRKRRRCQDKRKAIRTASKTRDGGRLPGVQDPRHVWKLNAREPGDPDGARRLEKAEGREGNSKGHSLHVRRREVGLLRSTGEGPNKGESLRRSWREGSGSRRTPWKNTRTGHRTGKPCQGDCQACGKPLKRGFAPNIRDKSRVR